MFLKKLFVGAVILIIIFTTGYPILFFINFYLSSQISGLYILPLILLFILSSVFVGEIFLTYKLPLIGFFSKTFLAGLSTLYKDFLVQAAKYFCEENEKRPFSKVVKVDIGNEIKLFGLVSYETETHKIVFIPTSPNPTSGFILIVPTEKVSETDIPTENIMKFTLTSGAFKMDDNYFK